MNSAPINFGMPARHGIFGSFGKGVKGSLSINFGSSGGKNCADSCPLKENGCYAQSTERKYPRVARAMAIRDGMFSEYLQALLAPKNAEKIARAPWIRFSVMGSLPPPAAWSSADRDALARLATLVEGNGNYHFPVETVEKALALRELGFAAVRVSDGEADTAIANGLPISKVVRGAKRVSMTRKKEKAVDSYRAAREFRADTGRTAVVCPGITGTAKCGTCTACANPAVDLVIYPYH